jgi:cell division transport system permease protein
VQYSLEEALVNLRRGGRSVGMSIGTIAIAFLTLGLFLLASANLQSVVDRWASAAEMSVYFRDDAEEAVREQLTEELKAHQAVAAVEYVTKEQALARFKQDFPELGDVAGGDNPFPASLEVRLRTDPASAGAADAMAGILADRPGVADVQYDRQWIDRLLAIVRSLRFAGAVVAAVLVLGAAFTVGAVVRLSLEGRRAEIDIMQLVGAPSAFVRGPSVVEGLLLGGIGAAVALAILWGGYVAMGTRLNDVVAALLPAGHVTFLSGGDVLLVLAAGLIVGALSGAIASAAA